MESIREVGDESRRRAMTATGPTSSWTRVILAWRRGIDARKLVALAQARVNDRQCFAYRGRRGWRRRWSCRPRNTETGFTRQVGGSVRRSNGVFIASSDRSPQLSNVVHDNDCAKQKAKACESLVSFTCTMNSLGKHHFNGIVSGDCILT